MSNSRKTINSTTDTVGFQFCSSSLYDNTQVLYSPTLSPSQVVSPLLCQSSAEWLQFCFFSVLFCVDACDGCALLLHLLQTLTCTALCFHRAIVQSIKAFFLHSCLLFFLCIRKYTEFILEGQLLFICVDKCRIHICVCGVCLIAGFAFTHRDKVINALIRILVERDSQKVWDWIEGVCVWVKEIVGN